MGDFDGDFDLDGDLDDDFSGDLFIFFLIKFFTSSFSESLLARFYAPGAFLNVFVIFDLLNSASILSTCDLFEMYYPSSRYLLVLQRNLIISSAWLTSALIFTELIKWFPKFKLSN